MIKKTMAFIAGLLVTYVVAVLFVSQFNIAAIADLGFPTNLSDRLATTLADQLGMVGLYLPLLGVALLIAWSFTGLLLTRFINRSVALYALAGLVGVITIHLVMVQVFGMHPVAPTRSFFGLASQGLAGLFGGIVFFRMAFPAQH